MNVHEKRPHTLSPEHKLTASKTQKLDDYFLDSEEVNDEFEVYDPLDDIPIPKTRPREAVALVHPAPNGPLKNGEDELAFTLSAGDFAPASRPYLSKRAREMPWSFSSEKTHAKLQGKIIHVDFTPEECLQLQAARRKYGPVNSVRFKDAFHSHLNVLLPSRTYEDCQQFEADNADLTPTGEAFAIQIADVEPEHPIIPNYLRNCYDLNVFDRRGCSFLKSANFLRSESILAMKPWKHFNETSGDTVSVGFDPSGRKMALGSTSQRGVYNRLGTLWLGDLLRGEMSVLKGHQTRSLEGDIEFRTISDVCFSNSGRHLFTGGFDDCVRIWTTEGVACDVFSQSKGHIQQLTLSRDDVLAASSKDGRGFLIRTHPETGKVKSFTELAFKKALEKRYEASLIEYTMPNVNTGGYVVVGYDNFHQQKNDGCAAVFDPGSGIPIKELNVNSEAIASLAIQPLSDNFIIGSNSHVSGRVRLFDSRTLSTVKMFNTPQKDINHTTVDRSGIFVTSSGTDNQTYVWDVRSHNKPLHVLKHGKTKMIHFDFENTEEVDAGINMALWQPDGSVFITGGSDGVVKAWDPRLHEPFVQNVTEVDAAVTYGCFSPDASKLVVCFAGGGMNIYSVCGNRPIDQFGEFVIRDRNAGEQAYDAVDESTGPIVNTAGSSYSDDSNNRERHVSFTSSAH
ncbi:Rik1-associated factor Raf1 [Schizosaccharomyces japonicus yFS275]|uniref:Rik1-associated factor Raf1 n=1 Tax=Schizosaccharomyces japonicus (strain yFS275 / FY16936) TaxID=402676 RepID=B6JWI1_SCHJY|nr:Rik1-associated factor Raf1 [Schizosaccharomyces japonicus yFS275]EEB05732.1 Rik1-associated factor Raf1 [Schizosaccharomyces japonicus yFS275]